MSLYSIAALLIRTTIILQMDVTGRRPTSIRFSEQRTESNSSKYIKSFFSVIKVDYVP